MAMCHLGNTLSTSPTKFCLQYFNPPLTLETSDCPQTLLLKHLTLEILLAKEGTLLNKGNACNWRFAGITDQRTYNFTKHNGGFSSLGSTHRNWQQHFTNLPVELHVN